MGSERTVILIKAAPHPSRKYQETVCCAGVTPEREWRRLFPIRYRHLSGEARFNRWDIVEYRAQLPRDDRRRESRRVEEQTLRIAGELRPAYRADFLECMLRRSAVDAAARGESLALVRPSGVQLRARERRRSDMEEELERIRERARQGSLLDAPLSELEPSTHNFSLTFWDEAGKHTMACGDWETTATFWKWRREYGAEAAIAKLKEAYEDRYAASGMALALGTVAKRPRQWLLLGVLRLDISEQPSLL